MYGFTASQLRTQGECFRLWRNGPVVAIELFGSIDDRGSEAWRTAVYNECDKNAWPRFFLVDMREADPQNSMAGRFRTASTGKIFLSRIEWMFALTGARPGPLFVLRTVLRVIGANNITLLGDETEFRRALDGALAGDRIEFA